MTALLKEQFQGLGQVTNAHLLEHKRTLVLNADYQAFTVLPLSVVGWREAITAIYLDKVEVVEVYSDVQIRSERSSMPLPSVVVNKIYHHPERQVAFSKNNVFLRDDYMCQYCGKRDSGLNLTYDHFIPRKLGGLTSWENIITACEDCNMSKGSKTFAQWTSPLGLKRPLHMPYKPSYYTLAGKVRQNKIIIPAGSGWLAYLQWEGPVFEKDNQGHNVQISGPETEDIGDELLGY